MGVGFTYASSVPYAYDVDLQIVKKYQEIMKKYYPEMPFNILSLSFFIQASVLVEAIRRTGGQITKEKIIEEIEKMQDYDLGGFKISFDPTTRYIFGKQVTLIDR
jgi:ABC-type branched-subunit amino acid transport system substrate-binding protein